MPLSTTIRPGRSDELDQIGNVLAHAFDEPVTRWLVPDPARRQVVMPSFFAEVAADALTGGLVDVVCDDTSGYLLAAAVWFDHTDHQRTGDIDPAPRDPGDEARWEAVFGPDVDRWAVLDGLMTRNHYVYPHWYLMCLGVRPYVQRQGLGTQLLTHRQTQLSYSAYLEATTPDSRRLYHRHGYTDLGDLRIPGGPRLWRMIRPADIPADLTELTDDPASTDTAHGVDLGAVDGPEDPHTDGRVDGRVDGHRRAPVR